MPMLAELEDVEAILGSPVMPQEIPRVTRILETVSESFRRESRQQLTPGSSHVRLKVNGGRVHLPQRPATDVISVADDSGQPVTWTRQHQWLRVQLGSDAFVTVTYEHGYPDVPANVRECVARAAWRAFTVSDDAARGVTQKMNTMGDLTHQESLAPWAAEGQATGLSPADMALARSYRPRVPKVWVMQP